MRRTVLALATVLGTALVAITETLGAVERIQRAPLAIAWLALACGVAIALALWRTKFHIRVPKRDPVVLLCVLACAAILVLTGATAILSPPNSADAMAYHIPRVVYWAEQSSVRVFPTPYLNQVMLQPFAEYTMLHLYVLTGDRAINLVQWTASAFALLAVSLAAALFGAAPRGQAIAALFCATLPSGILASSGAKNDYVLALWMIVAVCFALRFADRSKIADALLLGCAIGLALLTKATAWLFLPWLLGAILAARWRPRSARAVATLGAAMACALAINAPYFARNYRLSGSILGFDSAQGDGLFRWRNETFGWKPTASNLARNASEQLGARSEAWNRAVYDAVLAIHRRLGIDPDDPATTWPWARYAPPRNSNHEADAPNRWHLAILAAIACLIAWRRDRARALYLAALLCGFVAFCAYLKWQPFMARLVLPLFVAAAPLAAAIGEIPPRLATALLQAALCLFLLDNARRPLLQNWTRPLTGPNSILRVPRDDRYFADMSQWNNRDSYVRAAELLGSGNCDTVGIDINRLQVEYPLMALIRERRPSVRFLHTSVPNVSRFYRPPVDTPPCAVACLDCAGDPPLLAPYNAYGAPVTFGRFAIFRKP